MLVDLFEYIENKAPIIGPTIKPIENAIPTNAIAFPRFLISETSVIIAILNDIFPLLRPPTKRANTNSRKFDDIAQSMYEHEMPICVRNRFFFSIKFITFYTRKKTAMNQK